MTAPRKAEDLVGTVQAAVVAIAEEMTADLQLALAVVPVDSLAAAAVDEQAAPVVAGVVEQTWGSEYQVVQQTVLAPADCRGSLP